MQNARRFTKRGTNSLQLFWVEEEQGKEGVTVVYSQIKSYIKLLVGSSNFGRGSWDWFKKFEVLFTHHHFTQSFSPLGCFYTGLLAMALVLAMQKPLSRYRVQVGSPFLAMSTNAKVFAIAQCKRTLNLKSKFYV